MKKRGRVTRAGGTLLSLALMLAGCGGGGTAGGSPVTVGTPSGSTSPSPTPTATGACSLRTREDWVAAQMNEWYLFPDELPTSVDPAAYTTLSAYLDALTANARAKGWDRNFTYMTKISDEDAYYKSGTTVGMGFRLGFDQGASRLFVIEAFEGAPALAAGIDRGDEILEIGPSTGSMQSVSSIYASSGEAGLINALDANGAGVTRTLRIRAVGGSERTVTLSTASYDLAAVSPRYGAKVIDDGGTKVGYINLRTFITSADPALQQAFANFKAQGITKVIVDLRYNGGGLLSVAQTLGSLLGGNRYSSDVFAHLAYRASKASEDEDYYFQPTSDSVSPTKVAFISTGGTASASELVVNSLVPYLHGDVALVGANSYGKPVGQIALDLTACNDRLRVIAFATQNSAGTGDYFNGLATDMDATCQANDEIDRPLGDPQEASVRQALDYLEGASCTPMAGTGSGISGTVGATAASRTSARTLLVPENPTTPQREMPGIF